MQPRKGSIPRARRAEPLRAEPLRAGPAARPAGAAAPFSTAESSEARCRRGRPVRPGGWALSPSVERRGSARLGSAGRRGRARPHRAPAPPAAAPGSPAPVPPPARPRRLPQFPQSGGLRGGLGHREEQISPPKQASPPARCAAPVPFRCLGFAQPPRVSGLEMQR